MKLFSFLPKDRFPLTGVFVALDDHEAVLIHPTLCRGEADNQAAGNADNPQEDPVLPYGDHPDGLYKVLEVVDVHGPDRDRYGPFFIRLEPIDGDALRAKQAGRDGLGLHGGKKGQKGTPNALRATHGCLRLPNGYLVLLAGLLRSYLSIGRTIPYECRTIDDTLSEAA